MVVALHVHTIFFFRGKFCTVYISDYVLNSVTCMKFNFCGHFIQLNHQRLTHVLFKIIMRSLVKPMQFTCHIV